MKNRDYIVLGLLIFLLIAVIAGYMIRDYWASFRVTQLAEIGQSYFLANDFEPYMERMRQHGFDDLSAEVSFYYDEDYSYNEDTKTLKLSCYLNRLVSDKIDSYYTTEYNGSNGYKIAKIMEKMKDSYAIECTYKTEAGDTVIVEIYDPDHYVTIYTSSGREYEYVFGFIDSVRVEIDGHWVYSADVIKEEKPRGTHMPYVGMAESDIDTTCLGEPTTVEKCKDFYSLKASHRWTKYKWYEDDIQDLEHLKCIAKVWYYKYDTKREVPGYVYDVVIYD